MSSDEDNALLLNATASFSKKSAKRTRQRVDAGEPRNSYSSIPNFTSRPQFYFQQQQFNFFGGAQKMLISDLSHNFSQSDLSALSALKSDLSHRLSQSDLSALKSHSRDLSDLSALKSDLSQSCDLSSLKSDLLRRSDLGALKSDLGQGLSQSDLSALKSDLLRRSSNLSQNCDFNELRQNNDLSELKSDLSHHSRNSRSFSQNCDLSALKSHSRDLSELRQLNHSRDLGQNLSDIGHSRDIGQRQSDISDLSALKSDLSRQLRRSSELSELKSDLSDQSDLSDLTDLSRQKGDLSELHRQKTDLSQKSDLSESHRQRSDLSQKSDLSETQRQKSDPSQKSDLSDMQRQKSDLSDLGEMPQSRSELSHMQKNDLNRQKITDNDLNCQKNDLSHQNSDLSQSDLLRYLHQKMSENHLSHQNSDLSHQNSDLSQSDLSHMLRDLLLNRQFNNNNNEILENSSPAPSPKCEPQSPARPEDAKKARVENIVSGMSQQQVNGCKKRKLYQPQQHACDRFTDTNDTNDTCDVDIDTDDVEEPLKQKKVEKNQLKSQLKSMQQQLAEMQLKYAQLCHKVEENDTNDVRMSPTVNRMSPTVNCQMSPVSTKMTDLEGLAHALKTEINANMSKLIDTILSRFVLQQAKRKIVPPPPPPSHMHQQLQFKPQGAAHMHRISHAPLYGMTHAHAPPPPEQNEALSLVVAPKKKRHKVTDTRITPRTVSRILGGAPESGTMSPHQMEPQATPGSPRPPPPPYHPPPPPPPILTLPTSVAIPNPGLHESQVFSPYSPFFHGPPSHHMAMQASSSPPRMHKIERESPPVHHPPTLLHPALLAAAQHSPDYSHHMRVQPNIDDRASDCNSADVVYDGLQPTISFLCKTDFSKSFHNNCQHPTSNISLTPEHSSTLTPMHLRKAKLMFFWVRYPSSAVLKMYFPDIKFNKNNTAQLVKWFSNFREFYYIQMEKYARQAVSEGVKNADDLHVGGDSELYRVLNLHYNRNNHIEVPSNFRFVVEQTLREFFKAIQEGRDAEQSWKKSIYKIISRMDDPVPEYFKSPNFLEQLE